MLQISLTRPEALANRLGLKKYLSLADLARVTDHDVSVIRNALRAGRIKPDGATRNSILFAEDRIAELTEIIRTRRAA